ncbi:MAG: CHAT domain-containing protein [Gemmatimonadales bacterium]
MDFLDFEIHIAPGTGQDYPILVVKSPVGEASGTFHLPFDAPGLENHLKGVEIAVLKSGSVRRDIVMAADEDESVSDFGKKLFNALFTDQVATVFRRSQDSARAQKKGLRVRLRIDAPDLSTLPWEFMYDPSTGDYICLSSETPLVRYLQFDRAPEELTVKPPITILAMVASPKDRPTLDAAREKERMQQATAGLQAAGLLQIEWLEGSTWRDLQTTLRRKDYHIFHFVGHGGFDPAAGEGVLAFTDEAGNSQLLSATEVGRLLGDERTLRLVVLNSCLGAKGNTTDIFSSTSATLVRRGVPAVVAMQYEISDLAAIEFSRSLYEAIADGMPIDASVGEARKAISVSARNSVEWGTPVLHMRSPDGVLFTIDGPTTSTLKATGTYRAPPIQVPPPVTAPVAAAPQQFVSPPAAPPPAPPSGSGVWKGVAIGGGIMVALVIGVVYLLARDPATPDTSTEWVVQFESADTNHHGGWRRADGSTCVWNSYEDGFNLPYVQVPSPEGETWLVSEAPEEFRKDNGTLDDSAEVHLFFKNKGGEVEAFAGDSGRRTNDIFGRHVTITPKFGPIPAAGLPACETETPK